MFNDRIEKIIEYKFEGSKKDFLNFNEFHCYNQNSFDFTFKLSNNIEIDEMLNSSDLFDIPSSISLPRKYNEYKEDGDYYNLSYYYNNWDMPLTNIKDYFCTEKVSKINKEFNQNLMINLSLDLPFFDEFFKENKIFPIMIESVKYELDIDYLTYLVKPIEKFSIFKNYVFYFTPVVLFGIIVFFLLLRKLISEFRKYKEKYQ